MISKVNEDLRKIGFMDRRDHEARQAQLQQKREENIQNWRRIGSVLTRLGVAPKLASRLMHSRYFTDVASFTSDEILSLVEDLTEMVSGAVEFGLTEFDIDPGAVYDAYEDDERIRLNPENV